MAKPIITLNGLKMVIMLGMLVIILTGIRFADTIVRFWLFSGGDHQFCSSSGPLPGAARAGDSPPIGLIVMLAIVLLASPGPR